MFRRLRGGGRGGDDGRDEREDGDDRDRDGSGQMAPPPIAPPAIDTGPPMDMDAALEGLAGKQGLLDKVLRKFVETGPVALQEARPQWDDRQLEDLRRTAHSMKGSAGYLKADALIESSITLMAAAEAAIDGHEGDVPDALEAWESDLESLIAHVNSVLS